MQAHRHGKNSAVLAPETCFTLYFLFFIRTQRSQQWQQALGSKRRLSVARHQFPQFSHRVLQIALGRSIGVFASECIGIDQVDGGFEVVEHVLLLIF